MKRTLYILLLLCVACKSGSKSSMQHRCELDEIGDEYKQWLLECIKSGSEEEPGELVYYCETAARKLFCPLRKSCRPVTEWESCPEGVE